jgi:cysteine dioxygenase
LNLDAQIRELILEASVKPERPTPATLLSLIAPAIEPHLPRCQFDPSHYVRHPIHLSDGWEVMLIAWEAGQKTPIHDHRGALGSMAVFSGSLIEERFETPEGRPELIDRTARGEGDFSETSATVLHRLIPAKGHSVSLHIYRPPLREMGIWEPGGMTEIRPSRYDVAADILAEVLCTR